MARSAFETVIELQLRRFSPEQAKIQHIAIAKRGLAEFMASQSAKPMVSIETDGHPSASEQSVKPFGIITYRFNRMRAVIRYGIGEAERLSPVRSGKYRRSWFAMAENAEIGLDQIPPGKPIIITNDRPQSRKINVGAPGFEKYVEVPGGIVEKVRQLVMRRYGATVSAEVIYITLGGGHVLRRSVGRRKDRRAGADLTYPSILITPKF